MTPKQGNKPQAAHRTQRFGLVAACLGTVTLGASASFASPSAPVTVPMTLLGPVDPAARPAATGAVIRASTELDTRSDRGTVPPASPNLVIVDDSEVEREVHVPLRSAPDPIQTVIRNDGEETLSWRLAVDQPWLVLPTVWGGELESGRSARLEVELDPTQLSRLAAGEHVAQLSIQATRRGAGSETLVQRLGRGVRITVIETDFRAPRTRAELGVVALYDFEAPGNVVRDVSGVAPALDLTIADPNAVTWLPGRLRIDQATILESAGPATKVRTACLQADEISIEAWITPLNVTQDGPARIATISGGTTRRNVTLGQGMWSSLPKSVYNTRLRSTQTDLDGMPLTVTPTSTAEPRLQHVVFTRSANGTTRFYVDGAEVTSSGMGGRLSNWDSTYRLALANEIGAARPWLGQFHLVAFYGRALTVSEIAHLTSEGPGDIGTGVLNVTPGTQMAATADVGEMPVPSQFEYLLANAGTEPLQWRAQSNQPWAYVSPELGDLPPGASAVCRIHLTAATQNLAAGTYESIVTFQNATNGTGNTHRELELTITDPTGPPPPPPPPPPSGGRPGPHNTGPTNPAILVPTGSMVVTQHGAVIENVRVSGTIEVRANNVTIRNFVIDGGTNTPYGIRATNGNTGLLIEDGEIIRHASSGLFGKNFTARRLNIHEMQKDGMKLEGNNLVEACWVHHLGLAAGSHADGNQTRYGVNITMRGNYFDMPVGIPGGYKSNAASINQAEQNDIENLVMDSNWLNGGNYTVYFTADAEYGNVMRNCALINNRFGRDYRYGVFLRRGNVQNLTVSGNVWDDTGELMSINY